MVEEWGWKLAISGVVAGLLIGYFFGWAHYRSMYNCYEPQGEHDPAAHHEAYMCVLVVTRWACWMALFGVTPVGLILLGFALRKPQPAADGYLSGALVAAFVCFTLVSFGFAQWLYAMRQHRKYYR